MKLGVVLVGVVLACACSSSDGDGGSSPDGGAGSSGSSGSGGGAGSSGEPDVHCSDLSSSCLCVGDPDHLFGEGEGAPACTADMTQGFCCESLDYPFGISSNCDCQGWGCIENAAGCICSQADSGQPLKSCSQTWPSCCARVIGDIVTGCVCSQDEACDDPTEVAVPNCGPTLLKCRGETIETNSCKG